jgi:hypothetical protein
LPVRALNTISAATDVLIEVSKFSRRARCPRIPGWIEDDRRMIN